MKRCPECRRDYYDDTLAFCLEDGTALVQGSVPSPEEPQTAILHETAPPAEAATRAQIHTTEQTAVLPTGTGNVVEQSRGLDKRLLIPSFLLAVLVVCGFFAYRYLSATDMEQINSVAVLPFEDRSGSADTEYLSDGLADSLIYRLSQLPDLKVSPTSSVMRYKGKGGETSQIARELDVDAVMSGRLVQIGESLNISVQLIDARTDKLIWAEQYDRKMSDLLATQREIAAAISQKLQLKLAGKDTKGLDKKYTNSNEAYKLFMQAKFYYARRTKSDLLKSIDLYNEAIKLDPTFALAYVGIADSYSIMPAYPYASPIESFGPAKTATLKALELDPELAEAHTVAGHIAGIYDRDWPAAEMHFRRALELDPDQAFIHFRYAWSYLSPMGRHEEAIAEMQRAMELEPLSVIQGSCYAWILMYAGRFDEAVEQARKTYELDPSHVAAVAVLRWTLNARSDSDEARSLSVKQSNLQGWEPESQLAYEYAKAGQRDLAEKAISLWREERKGRYISSYWFAIVLAAYGDTAGAFDALETAYRERDSFIVRLKSDPFLKQLQGDPRFATMLKRLGLPE